MRARGAPGRAGRSVLLKLAPEAAVGPRDKPGDDGVFVIALKSKKGPGEGSPGPILFNDQRDQSRRRRPRSPPPRSPPRSPSRLGRPPVSSDRGASPRSARSALILSVMSSPVS
jgi:hypothetical protein